jgi:alpha-glucosidase
MADGGYDVADYRDVDPLFGTLSDFDALVRDAHAKGLRVIVDIVPNHSSVAHPWFVAALKNPAARHRYHFRPGRGDHGELPPNNWQSVFGGPAWTRITEPDGTPGPWYLHLFDVSQPDFNWADPDVRTEFIDILHFWLKRGVDGFRIDVAHGLVKASGLPDWQKPSDPKLLGVTGEPYWDQDRVHEIYREWRSVLDSYGGDRMAVAESWAPSVERLAMYVRPDELHQAFNFFFLQAPWDAAAMRGVIDTTLRLVEAAGAPPTWVLSNHDVVRHLTRYGSVDRARAAALLMLALPGSAYLYQGEELGLPEVQDLPDDVLQDPVWERSRHTQRGRDGVRVPLPWSGEKPPYGFGSGSSWLPQPDSWVSLTAEREAADEGSMLMLYRRALSLRRFLDGPLQWAESPSDHVLSFMRGSALCTVNFGDDPVQMDAPGRVKLASAPVVVTGGRAELPGPSAVWWDTTAR